MPDTRGNEHGYRDKCIYELFEFQAGRTPEAVAVVFKGQQWTYEQLHRRAHEIVDKLLEAGAGPGVLVGILLKRSFDLVASMLAALMSGAAFLLLDTTYPQSRLQFMMEDSQCRLLLTHAGLLPMLPSFSGTTLCVDAPKSQPHQTRAARAAKPAPDDLAYLMYTSGSTGRPKGALFNHRGVVNYLEWLREMFHLSARDVVLQLAPVSFDPCLREFFGPLSVGGQLLLLQEDRSKLPDAVLAEIRRHGVTCLLAVVPTLLRALVQEATAVPGGTPSLRLMLVSGEPLLRSDVIAARAALGEQVLLVNQYGPTECCMIATYYPVVHLNSAPGVPIGKPISNVEIFLLDNQKKPVPPGAAGEIYIGGVGLSRGYLNRPELTAEKFISHPLRPGARLYRTGDIARFLLDSNLEFMSRIDTQVKIRGQRVELGEIETVLREHASIRTAVVLVQQGPDGDERLVAYVIPRRGRAPTQEGLRNFLIRSLPEYMVPSYFAFMSAFPLTPSGKVDRRAFPAVDWSVDLASQDYVAPRSEVEEELAKIFREVLRLNRIGVNDNFFLSGGHSLLATQALSRINRKFKQHLRLGQFFEAPTVSGMAQLVTAAALGERSFDISRGNP